MEAQVADVEKKQAAVYVGWTTFKNSLTQLAEGVPNVIDRTAFPGQSGGVQSQLLAGLKFLGLIDESGKPTQDLHGLAVRDEAARKEAMKRLLQERYAALFDLGLDKATPGQLAEALSKHYNVSGDTRDKAMRFFLLAAKYSGVKVSRFLAKGAGVRKPRAARRGASNSNDAETDPPAPDATPSTTARTVTLASGGSLTLSADFDVFTISAEDRAFVFGLIDSLIEYEKQHRQSPLAEALAAAIGGPGKS
jgi:hypothetical protein